MKHAISEGKWETHSLCKRYISRVLAWKEKNYVICKNWEIKHNCESSVGSLGDQGVKPSENLEYLA